jgi:hypothetical protein
MNKHIYISEVIQYVERLPSDFSKYVKCSKEEYTQSIINPNSTKSFVIDKLGIYMKTIYGYIFTNLYQFGDTIQEVIPA